MNAFSVAGVAIIVAILAQMLKKSNPEFAGILTISAGALFFLTAVTTVIPALIEIEQLIRAATASNEWIIILLKCLGTCLLVQFAADCCRDVGESALAGRVEFAGKTAVIIMALPMFRAILELSVHFMQ